MPCAATPRHARRCHEPTAVQVFPEGPTAVAIHPAGFQLLVGFVDKLRLLNVLMDDLREVKEFPIKSCTDVRFSRGGHLFAAAHTNVIVIYGAYTGEYMCTLRGHNGKVTGLQWSYNDATLVSCSSDGTVYEWDLSGEGWIAQCTDSSSRSPPQPHLPPPIHNCPPHLAVVAVHPQRLSGPVTMLPRGCAGPAWRPPRTATSCARWGRAPGRRAPTARCVRLT